VNKGVNDTELRRYLDLLFSIGFEESDNYKNTLLPNKLYKYFPLDDNSESDHNLRLFRSILKEELWLSSHRNFKDLLEFKSLYINKDNMNANNYDANIIEKVERFYELTKSTVLVSCFTKKYDNMAMWSHYSNEHRGYCVEYEILNKRNFYPVIYKFDPQDAHQMLVLMIDTFREIIRQEKNTELNENYKVLENLQMTIISLLYLNYSTKKTEWDYEEEVRIIYSEEKPLEVNGMLYDYSKLRIDPKRIILGYNCTDQNEGVLRAVAQRIGVTNIERFDIHRQLK
jgi:hypothetical protein